MKIAVLVAALGPDSPRILGRCERSALATALRLADDANDIVAMSATPEEGRCSALALAGRVGIADRVCVAESALARTSYLGIAHVLAAAVTKAAASVVLVGERAECQGSGTLGPALAEVLGCAYLPSLVSLKRDADRFTAVSHGRMVRVVTQAPMFVAGMIDHDRAAPVTATWSGRATTEPTLWTADRLGLDPGELFEYDSIVARAAVEPTGDSVTVTDADGLIERLSTDGLLT